VEYGPAADQIAFQIHLTWRAIRKRLLAEVEKGQRPVARGTYSIPMLIGLNPGISPLQLAEALYLDPSKIAYFLRDLEKRGLITRTKSQGDRRMVELDLTPIGREFMQEAIAGSRQLEAPFDDALSDAEAKQLVHLLKKLRDKAS
jgi:DNA-binding MarR family transcriptional regulator